MTHQLSSLRLKRKYDYLEFRIRIALRVAGIATLGVTIAVIVFFALNLFQRPGIPQKYHLYSEFVGWGGNPKPFEVCDSLCEVVQHFLGLLSAAEDVPKSVMSVSDNAGNIAAIARLCSLVAVGISVVFAYRTLLKHHYKLVQG